MSLKTSKPKQNGGSSAAFSNVSDVSKRRRQTETKRAFVFPAFAENVSKPEVLRQFLNPAHTFVELMAKGAPSSR